MHLSNKASRGFLTSVDRNLATSAAVVAAGIAGVASFATQPAQAIIVYSGLVNLNVPSTTAGIYLNVVTNVSATTPGGAPGWDINPWGSTAFNVWANNGASPNDGVIQNFTGGNSATLVDNVPLGTLNDNTWSYGRTSASETAGLTAFQLNSSNNYIGFRFLNEGTGLTNFGWAHFSLSTSTSAQPRTLIDYAYENTGLPIIVGAGAVPEPASLGLLAVGAVGLLKRRSR